MNIYKLLIGVAIMLFLILAGPYILANYGLMAPLNDKAWIILIVTAAGLVIKQVVGDVVAGEFLFHKFGYDNCVITFGSTLTALALQLISSGTDLFPGISSVIFLKDIPSISSNPGENRSLQLFIYLLIALVCTLITGAISSAINRDASTKGKNFLALVNSTFGVVLLGFYVVILISKG